jgi:eukaryotic-like serine/threonine-protein kinase
MGNKNKFLISTLSLITFSISLSIVVATSAISKSHIALAQTVNKLETYQNSSYGIRIQYPSDWEKQENGTKQDTQTNVVTFFPQASNASFDIAIDDITDEKGITISQYSGNSIDDLRQSAKDFKLVESNTTGVFLAGLPAYKLVYTSTDQTNSLKTMEIGAIKDNKAFVVTYEAGTAEYDKYLPRILGMISSFTITR